MRIYGDLRSGNCYKVKLILHLLDRPHEWVDVDVMAGATKQPDFLAINPNGRVPVAQIPGKGVLTESNAILNYIAMGTPYYPEDPWTRARIQQWQFFEQYTHEPSIAVNRFIMLFQNMPEWRQAEFEAKVTQGYHALDVMESALRKQPFLCGDTYTTADIALYAYTHVAHEGGFDLGPYPSIIEWIDRIQFLPRHVTLDQAKSL
ncbi:MAG: glutathione S-transferase family protein [Acidobacteria bacterium]|nr:glutathione S-transferase family protein [Acidobacteriota bacterium]